MAEHFILEYDEESRYALVKLTAPTSVTPYVVCYGYDPEGCDWRQGSYHEKLDEALADYRNATRNVDEEEESTVRGFALHGVTSIGISTTPFLPISTRAFSKP